MCTRLVRGLLNARGHSHLVDTDIKMSGLFLCHMFLFPREVSEG